MTTKYDFLKYFVLTVVEFLRNDQFFMVKLLRADGGCLGIDRRRRTWKAAISFGELLTGFDPEDSEWGNPARFKPGHHALNT